jgi:putative ABC transport system permease protein
MVSLALLVGVVGIINTMLMSTTERFAEFGVLRTNGWSERNVLALVTAESACLGLLAGLIGCVLAIVGAFVVNQFLDGGLQLHIGPQLIGLGLALAIGMGTIGGLYPAWRAARLVPMEAIRLGAH